MTCPFTFDFYLENQIELELEMQGQFDLIFDFMGAPGRDGGAVTVGPGLELVGNEIRFNFAALTGG